MKSTLSGVDFLFSDLLFGRALFRIVSACFTAWDDGRLALYLCKRKE